MRGRLPKKLDLLAGDIRELQGHTRDPTAGTRKALSVAPTNRQSRK
jgi:hypothetical protein